MNHEEIRSTLHEFRDGELGPAREAEVRAHLEACAGCRGALERWAGLAAAAFPRVPTPVPEHFISKTMARIDADEEAGSGAGAGFFGWLPPALAFAAAALILFMAGPVRPSVSVETLLFRHEAATSTSSVVAGTASDLLGMGSEEL